MRLFVAVVFVLALGATACGPDDAPFATRGDGEIGAVADDSSPRAEDGRDVLSRCGGDRPDITQSPVEGPADFELTLRSDVVPRGGSFEFEWRLPAGMDITTGDEWVVQCWSERAWESAWMVTDVFANYGGPNYVYLDDGYGTTDDGFTDSVGTIVVPPDAPTGWYRLVERVALHDGESSSQLLTREAWFEVSG